MVLLLLFIAFVLYGLISSAVDKYVSKKEDEEISKRNLYRRKELILTNLEIEFPAGAKDLKKKCKSLYDDAFKIIPRLNRYTSLRNIRNRRYVN